MPRDLIPELHDVLKLTILKHNFSDFGPYQLQAPNTPTWRGVLQHHCDEAFPAYPTARDTFLLHVADGLASGFSRLPQSIRHDIAWTIHRLWNPKSVCEDQRLSSQGEISEMLTYFATDPGFEDFYKRYRSIFQTRSEDAHPGMNVTNLETHVRLVGRFYRFLQRSSQMTVTEEEVEEAVARGVAASGGARTGKPELRTAVESAQIQPLAALRERKLKDWKIYLFRCWLRFLPNPFRARDLSIFTFLDEFRDQIRARFGDNLLFASSEEMLVYSDSPELLEELRSLAVPRGICLDVITRSCCTTVDKPLK